MKEPNLIDLGEREIARLRRVIRISADNPSLRQQLELSRRALARIERDVEVLRKSVASETAVA